MPDREEIDRAWRSVIRELEADVERLRAGATLTYDVRMSSAQWSAPTMPGPLPDEYAQHVLGLIDAQREAIEHLEHTRQTAAGHLDALRAVGSAIDRPGSVYLDVEG